MTDAELDQALADAAMFDVLLADANAAIGVDRLVVKLVAEIRRLKRGDFTPEEFQALCHHLDEKPGCTRAIHEAGCREYHDKLFGPKSCSISEPDAIKIRVIGNVSHPTHVWNDTALNQCIRCGVFRSSREAWFACEPAKIAGKVEFCCECAAEYPAGDLIAGHIYCPKCRKSDGAPCA